jgi:ring-1,2-phenylacetyl-CoA epoxidase subunit PaaD
VTVAASVLGRVLAALDRVEDPEMPVTLSDLGVIRTVEESNGRVHVQLVPTFLACPARWVVESDVIAAALAVEGVGSCSVEWVEGGWTASHVTDAGRVALAGIGVAIPNPDGTVRCPFCGHDAVEESSPFGSAVCRASAYCPACSTPFETLKVKRAASLAESQAD